MSWSILDLIRNSPDKLKDNLKRRFIDVSIVDRIVELDRKWRQKLNEINKLRHEHNKLSQEVSRAPQDQRQAKIQEAKKLLEVLQQKESELKSIEEERESLLLEIPNLVSEEAPVGPDETYSKVLKVVGKPKVFKGYLNDFLSQLGGLSVDYEIIEWKPIGHADLMEGVLKLGNTLKAGEVAGSRFYYLFGDLVWLDFALTMYALDLMTSKGYRLVIPPYMLKGEVMRSVIDLATFKDAIYKVEGEDLYLISTAEHSLAALHFKEDIEAEELPLKYVGFSPAFRKEAGAANKDVKGIFRVHQFHKVEQFVFSMPEGSWAIHLELLSNAEEIFKGLGIPYRVIDIATGDLGACAARKYDLEGWMPAQGRFRELVSCSNCLDWQAYRMGIRFVDRKNNRKGYVHTLNSTAVATSRTITSILENFQDREGVVEIPRVLRKYLELFQTSPKEFIHPVKRPQQ
jgi:seryl-tRNA synthetase